jgi:hypothetical protein
MTRYSSRWKAAALLLALTLAAPLALASEPRAPTRPVEAPSFWGLLDKIRQFLSASVWNKCGGSADPDGLYKSQPPGNGSSKCGASADPNGLCKSQPAAPGASSDNGASADPDG